MPNLPGLEYAECDDRGPGCLLRC